jgi:hypothetical protein
VCSECRVGYLSVSSCAASVAYMCMPLSLSRSVSLSLARALFVCWAGATQRDQRWLRRLIASGTFTYSRFGLTRARTSSVLSTRASHIHAHTHIHRQTYIYTYIHTHNCFSLLRSHAHRQRDGQTLPVSLTHVHTRLHTTSTCRAPAYGTKVFYAPAQAHDLLYTARH